MVLIPSDNEKDLIDIPSEVIDSLKIIPVQSVNKVFEIALEYMPMIADLKQKPSDLDSTPPNFFQTTTAPIIQTNDSA